MFSLLQQYLVVGLGGAFGSILRFALAGLIDSRITRAGQAFPWGTITVNVTGCFMIGLLFSIFGSGFRSPVSELVRVFLLIGVLGGYTTFSSFGLQTFVLAEGGNWLGAMANVFLSVVLCLLGVWLGAFVGQLVQPR